MEIGKLNQRITFLEHYTKVDEIGNHEVRWDEAFSCWAYVLSKSSSETTEAGVTKEVLSLSFVVRQCAFHQCVNPTTHKILFRGAVYDIKSVIPDYQKNDYLTFVCEVRKAGGENDIY